MSVSYAGSAAYSTTACNIVMTTGANQTGSIIQNVASPNTFIWVFTYIAGSNNSNCTFGWGDSNTTLSIQLNHHASNIKL
jgi:frataxin-like iron-binding protein CyaY